MELGFFNEMPNYAGGLGILAADFLMSSADIGAGVVGVSLFYHQDDDREKAFDPSPYMKRLDKAVEVEIEDRKVKIAIWQMDIKGKSGHIVPVLFLSSFVPENERWDRDLTRNLYAPDRYTRLGQEVILGIGGVRALDALGYSVGHYHMNEGHTALGILELLRKYHSSYEKIRSACSLTVHTPLPSGREGFDYDLVFKTLGRMAPANLKELGGQEIMSMTRFAMRMCGKTNSVSEKHKTVCEKIYSGFAFKNVTNGIYHPRWVGKHMKNLFDRELSGWEQETEIFKNLSRISDNDLNKARLSEKKDFINWVNGHAEYFPFNNTGVEDMLKEDVLTIGFARRFVPYKRPALIFSDLGKLRSVGAQKVQFVYSYRCYPDDSFCNDTKRFIEECANKLRGDIMVAMIPDYNIDIAKRMVTGCDIWLNNPVPEHEASGTSGMKAALNGITNLSVADGWWLEGYRMNEKSGWMFGGNYDGPAENRDEFDASELYKNLQDAIDCYYNRIGEWSEKQKASISLVSFFNTHRVVRDYQEKMWGLL